MIIKNIYNYIKNKLPNNNILTITEGKAKIYKNDLQKEVFFTSNQEFNRDFTILITHFFSKIFNLKISFLDGFSGSGFY